MTNNFNGTSQIKNGMNTGEIVGLAMGLFVFSLSIYAFSLAIKANKLTIKKLNNEKYK